MNIDRKVLEILVCPVTKTGLRYDCDAQELISDRAKLAYTIENGLPIMIADMARQLDARDIKK